MSASVEDGSARHDPTEGHRAHGQPAVDALAAASICPYLVALDGTWRSAFPARDHRCAAVRPLAPLTVEKQRDVCLGAAHVECSTYRAAIAASRRGWATPDDRQDPGETGLWPVGRTLPVVLEPGGPRTRFGSLPVIPGRLGGQIVLGLLMVLAFIAVVLARASAPPGPVVDPSASPTAAVSPSPVASPTVRPTPTPAASPSAAAGSAVPSGVSPVPSAPVPSAAAP